jgi:hypothetical protein
MSSTNTALAAALAAAPLPPTRTLRTRLERLLALLTLEADLRELPDGEPQPGCPTPGLCRKDGPCIDPLGCVEWRAKLERVRPRELPLRRCEECEYDLGETRRALARCPMFGKSRWKLELRCAAFTPKRAPPAVVFADADHNGAGAKLLTPPRPAPKSAGCLAVCILAVQLTADGPVVRFQVPGDCGPALVSWFEAAAQWARRSHVDPFEPFAVCYPTASSAG